MQDVLSRLFSRQSLCRSFACLVMDPGGHQTHRWCRNPRRNAIDHVLRKARPRTGPWLCFAPNLPRTQVHPRLKHSKRIWIMNLSRPFQVFNKLTTGSGIYILTQDFLSFLQSWCRIESIVGFRATLRDHLQIFVYRGSTCRNRPNRPWCRPRLPGLTNLSSATPSIQLLQPSNHICAHHSCSWTNLCDAEYGDLLGAERNSSTPILRNGSTNLFLKRGWLSTPNILFSIVNRGRTTSCPK